MRELTVDAIVRLACTALERTCFLEAHACGPAARSTAPLAHFAKIGYRGPEEGFVVLAATEGFVKQLARGVVGDHVEPMYVAKIGGDALLELTNILAGSIVRELGGEMTPFQLGFPSQCDNSALPHSAIIAMVGLEGERLEVHWMRGHSAQAA